MKIRGQMVYTSDKDIVRKQWTRTPWGDKHLVAQYANPGDGLHTVIFFFSTQPYGSCIVKGRNLDAKEAGKVYRDTLAAIRSGTIHDGPTPNTPHRDPASRPGLIPIPRKDAQ